MTPGVLFDVVAEDGIPFVRIFRGARTSIQIDIPSRQHGRMPPSFRRLLLGETPEKLTPYWAAIRGMLAFEVSVDNGFGLSVGNKRPNG